MREFDYEIALVFRRVAASSRAIAPRPVTHRLRQGLERRGDTRLPEALVTSPTKAGSSVTAFEIVATVLSGVSLFVAVWSVIVAIRANRKSSVAESDAAAALTASATTQERIAETLERATAKPPPVVSWGFKKMTVRDTFRLFNTGTSTAHQVALRAEPEDQHSLLHVHNQPTTVARGESVTFMGEDRLETRLEQVRVDWIGDDGAALWQVVTFR